MKSYTELLQTETYWTTKIQTDLFNAVEIYLQKNQMTRTQFAAKLGVTKGYVTQILKGDFDHRLSKLVEIALLIGKVPVFTLEDKDDYLANMNASNQKKEALSQVAQ